MFNRPSQKDTEDDLLKLQQQFLSSKTSPSVQIIRPGDKRKSPKSEHQREAPDGEPSTAKQPTMERDVVSMGDLPSRFAHTTASTSVAHGEPSGNVMSNKKHKSQDVSMTEEDPEEAMDKHDSHITKVLTEIVERDSKAFPVYCPSTPTPGGFPKVLHRGILKQSTGAEGGKKKSLFAQQCASQSGQDFGLPHGFKKRQHTATSSSSDKKPAILVSDTVRERDVAAASSAMATSNIIRGDGLDPKHGSGEATQIHTENQAKIAGMGEAEILAEQKKLLELLDPGLVSFLRTRKSDQQKSTEEGSTSTTLSDWVTAAGTSTDETSMETSQQACDKNKASKYEETSMDTSDLPVAPSKDWLHMDQVEGEKLAWMKDLPPPVSGDTKTGKPARFDFRGNLVATDAEVPMHHGLHHHGIEPERAGYSLEELFHLARSAHIQQRALAINTMAKIIENAKHGIFSECVSTALVPAMVDGGLVFILRWALDDSTDNTMTAAVNCLHALLVTREEEEALDHVFCWYRGHEVPCMCPVIPPASDEQTESANDKLSDAELLKQDLIKGLLQMSLLPRLRYILEVWRPPALVVIQVLDILIRVARHSPEGAYQVNMCPRLIETIFKEFLPWQIPDKWTEVLTEAYGRPCSRALKLVRVICASGRNMASSMISHMPLMDRMVLYISQQQESDSSDHEEFQRLILESFRTWKILVAYGLTLKHYSEYYPILMKMLQKLCAASSVSSPTDAELSSTLLSFLESVTHAAANVTQRVSQELSRERLAHNQPQELEHKESPPIPDFNWSHVTGLIQPIQIYLQNELEKFTKSYSVKKYNLSLLAACLNFVASWLSRADNMPGYDAIEHLNRLEQLCDSFLLAVLKCQGVKSTLTTLRHTSVLLCSESPKSTESLSSLAEFGVFIGNEATLCPVVTSQATVHFVLAFTRLLTALKTHNVLSQKAYGMFLEDEELLQYLRKVCQAKRSPTANNYFVQFENHLQMALLSLVRHKGETPSTPIYHQVALYLLTHVAEGQEATVHQLLSNVIFNRDFLSDIADDTPVPSLESRLDLNEDVGLRSATQRTVSGSVHKLLTDCLDSMSSVRNTYMTAFGGFQRSLERSRCRGEETASTPETFVLGTCGQLLVPVDWPFLPLIEIYNKTATLTASRGVEESLSPNVILMVANTLRWVYLVETTRPGVLDSVSLSLKLSRILCTFLAGSDLFLDSAVQCYLAALLKIYCKPVHLDRMEFSEKIPGLASFYDLYMMLLDQYEAVSFGDSVFGCYILLPLQQKHNILLRKAVWGERSAVLRSLFIPIKEVLIPLSRFLDPEESDLELIRLYFQALFKRAVSPSWCPLFYLVAVHHVNRFFYTQGGKHTKLRRAMIQQILQAADQTLKHHLLHYKSANSSQELGMDFYENLPSIRRQLIHSIQNTLS